MASLLKLVLGATGPRTLKSFQKQCQLPRQTQENLLNVMIRQNEDTQFGRDYNFKSVRSYEDFKKVVPLATYDTLSPYIDATFEGKECQLTAEKPVFYATTSGTTGKPKYIPVTPSSRSAKSQLQRVWFVKMFKDHPTMFDGKVLSVVSPEAETYSPTGVPCGAESGHGYRNMPKATNAAYSCPYEVYAEKNYDAKYYALLRMAAGQNITFMYTVNPSTVLLLAKRLGMYTEEIIKDVRDGALTDRYALSQELRDILGPLVKPDPERAKALEVAAAKNDGILLPKHVWPNLAAIGCWKGGSVGPYVDQFPQFYPESMATRDVGYYASEQRGSVPMQDAGCAGALAIPTNVYEFYPARLDATPGPEDLLAAHELEKGQQYFVYVTTFGGLYRYAMGDIIEVTGYYEQTPMIRFLQKEKGFVSFTGEKLYETQVIDAVTTGLSSYGGSYEFIAAVGEIVETMPQYKCLVEFDQLPDHGVVQNFANTIEERLQGLNIEYESKRKSDRLHPLSIKIVKPGEFERYRKRKVEQEGKNDGQFKILKLTKDSAFGQEFECVGEIVATKK